MLFHLYCPLCSYFSRSISLSRVWLLSSAHSLFHSERFAPPSPFCRSMLGAHHSFRQLRSFLLLQCGSYSNKQKQLKQFRHTHTKPHWSHWLQKNKMPTSYGVVCTIIANTPHSVCVRGCVVLAMEMIVLDCVLLSLKREMKQENTCKRWKTIQRGVEMFYASTFFLSISKQCIRFHFHCQDVFVCFCFNRQQDASLKFFFYHFITLWDEFTTAIVLENIDTIAHSPPQSTHTVTTNSPWAMFSVCNGLSVFMQEKLGILRLGLVNQRAD